MYWKPDELGAAMVLGDEWFGAVGAGDVCGGVCGQSPLAMAVSGSVALAGGEQLAGGGDVADRLFGGAGRSDGGGDCLPYPGIDGLAGVYLGGGLAVSAGAGAGLFAGVGVGGLGVWGYGVSAAPKRRKSHPGGGAGAAGGASRGLDGVGTALSPVGRMGNLGGALHAGTLGGAGAGAVRGGGVGLRCPPVGGGGAVVRQGWFWVASGVGLLLDQLSKYGVVHHFGLGESWPLWAGVFHLTYVLNTGAAFSLFAQGTAWLRWLSVLVSAGLLALAVVGPRLAVAEQWGYGLILAGAMGNGIDRFRLGAVIDFLDVRWINFPIFNLADVWINLGLVCLFWHYLRSQPRPNS